MIASKGWPALWVALLLALGTRAAAADDHEAGKRESILSGLQDVLSFRSASEAYAQACQLSSADHALEVMKRLAEQKGDPAVAAKASLWIGHYDYGAGWLADALTAFEAATGGGDEKVRAEARFWVLQCRNLLEAEGDGPALDSPARSGSDVLAALAEGDRALRRGDLDRAVKLYLEAQGDAERLDMLGPLYYRLALLVAASPEVATTHGLNLDLLKGWQDTMAASPERALAASFAVPKSFAKPAAPPEQKADSTATAAAPIAPVAQTPPPPAVEPASEYSIQLGAFRERDRARAEMEGLTNRGLSVRLESYRDSEGAEWWRIRLGREASRSAAEALAARVCQGLDYQIVLVGP